LSKPKGFNKYILEIGDQADPKNAGAPEFFVGMNPAAPTLEIAGIG
jgi:hypothetical protein